MWLEMSNFSSSRLRCPWVATEGFGKGGIRSGLAGGIHAGKISASPKLKKIQTAQFTLKAHQGYRNYFLTGIAKNLKGRHGMAAFPRNNFKLLKW